MTIIWCILSFCITLSRNYATDCAQDATWHAVLQLHIKAPFIIIRRPLLLLIIATTNWAAILWVHLMSHDGLASDWSLNCIPAPFFFTHTYFTSTQSQIPYIHNNNKGRFDSAFQQELSMRFHTNSKKQLNLNASSSKTLYTRMKSSLKTHAWVSPTNTNTNLIYINPNTIKSCKILQKLSPKHAVHGVAQSPYPIYRHGKACLSKQPPWRAAPDPRLACDRSRVRAPGPAGMLHTLFFSTLPSSFGR